MCHLALHPQDCLHRRAIKVCSASALVVFAAPKLTFMNRKVRNAHNFLPALRETTPSSRCCRVYGLKTTELNNSLI